MKIGMISQWYEPETGSAAHPTAIARALSALGHEVKVLTAFPSYPHGRVSYGYSMSWTRDEELQGIKVRRIPDMPSHDQNALRRAASLVTFAGSATLRSGWLRDCDVVLVYLTPSTVGLPAWLLERLRGVPYVLYVQDLWPETITASGFIGNARLNRVIERVLHRLLRGLYRRASGTAAISPSMALMIGERGAVVPPRSVPNWIEESIFRPAATVAAPELPADKRWVMYAGGIGDVQALEHAVHALALLGDLPGLGLAFVGDGVARPGLERRVTELGLGDRVLFLGARAMEEMPGLMAQAAAQLVSLKDLPLFSGTIPSKVQASMACGAPIVCAVAGDAATVVAEADAGFVVPPEDAPALAAAFRAVHDADEQQLRRMGSRGRDYYIEFLSAASGAASLEEMLRTAAKGRKR